MDLNGLEVMGGARAVVTTLQKAVVTSTAESFLLRMADARLLAS